MNVPVAPALAGLLTSIGLPRLLADPGLAHRLLTDLLPDRPQEVWSLTAALHSGAVAELNAPTGRPGRRGRGDPRTQAGRLAAAHGLDPAEAEWAVRTWSQALQLAGVVPGAAGGPGGPGTGVAGPVAAAGFEWPAPPPPPPTARPGRTYAMIGALMAVGLVLLGAGVWTTVRIAHWIDTQNRAAPQFPAPFTPDGRYGYLTAGGPDAPGLVSVVDTNTNQVVHTISVGRLPGDATVSADGQRIYVPNAVDGSVSVIDGGAFAVVATIMVGSNPGDVVLTGNGRLGLVTNYSQQASTVTVFDTASDKVVGTIPVGRNPGDVVLSAGNRGFVTNYSAGTVTVLDAAGSRVVRTLTVGKNPSDPVVSDDGHTVYVTNDAAPGSVTVIDADTLQTSTIAVGINPEPIVLGYADDAYVTNYRDATVSVIDTSTDRVVKILPVGRGPSPVTLNSSGERGYVTNLQDGTVTVIDTSRVTVSDTIRVGSHPDGVMFSNDDAEIYVHNHEDLSNAAPGSDPTVPQTVSTISARTGAVTKTTSIGADVDYVTLAPDGVHLYVAHGTGQVTVVGLM